MRQRNAKEAPTARQTSELHLFMYIVLYHGIAGHVPIWRNGASSAGSSACTASGQRDRNDGSERVQTYCVPGFLFFTVTHRSSLSGGKDTAVVCFQQPCSMVPNSWTSANTLWISCRVIFVSYLILASCTLCAGPCSCMQPSTNSSSEISPLSSASNTLGLCKLPIK